MWNIALRETPHTISEDEISDDVRLHRFHFSPWRKVILKKSVGDVVLVSLLLTLISNILLMYLNLRPHVLEFT